MSYNPNAGGGGPPADGSISSAKLGGDITAAGKSIITAASNAAQKSWLAHAIGDVSGLQTALDAKAASSHTHSAADLTSGTVNTARLGSGTANSTTFLRGDNTWATPASGGGGTWTLVGQGADAVVNNSTTFQTSDLTFSAAANTRYQFKGRVWIDTGATADYKIRFTGPTSPALVRITTATIAGGGTALGNIRTETAFGTSRAVTGTGTNGGYVEFDGILLTGANAGDVTFEWGQNSLEAVNTTLRAGSYLEYRTV